MHIVKTALLLWLIPGGTFLAISATRQVRAVAVAIKVSVSLVDLPVSVTGSQGQFISGLNEENFRVYEDGRLQKITMFEDEDIPVAVGLVVDHSGSMRQILPEVSAAAGTFARSSNPKDDMFVVDFNDLVSLGLPSAKPFTSDFRQLEKAVSGMNADGRTALNDAILVAVDHLRSSHLDRQSLIIVSDGGDNASTHKFGQVLSEVRASKATIYSIGIFGANQADQNPAVLEKLAKVTGGKAYFPNSVTEVASICRQIARNIREQYVLGYNPATPSPEGSYRKIKVEVSVPSGHEKLHVRTRTGYLSRPRPNLAGATGSS